MIKIYFDDNLIDPTQYKSLNHSYKLFNDNDNFTLGSVTANKHVLIIPKELYIDSDIVTIYDDEKLIATLSIDSLIDNDDNTYSITLVDSMTKFEDRYDASPLIKGDSTITIKDVLKDICSTFGVELGTDDFLNSSEPVNSWNNRINARTYISFIAELNGGFAFIGADGKLYLKRYNTEKRKYINLNETKKFKIHEKHVISRVIYDVGAVKYEFGDESGETIYLSKDNRFINNKKVVENIYNAVVGLEFYSIKCDQCEQLNVEIGDCICFRKGEVEFPSFAQFDNSYNGGWLGGYSFLVKNSKQKETNVVGDSEKIKDLIIDLDYLNQKYSIESKEIKEQFEDLRNPIRKIQSDNHLCIYDAAEENALEYKIYGKCEQEYESSIQKPCEIKTINEVKVKITGKNLFESENGKIDDDGTESNTLYSVRSKGFIDCSKNKTFAFSKKIPMNGSSLNGMLRCYDENKKFLFSLGGLSRNQTKNVVTMPDEVKYFRFVQFGSESEDPQKVDYEIQIENNNEVTEYQQYKSNEIKYDLKDNELCSIDDVKDELDIVTGNLVKKIAKITLTGQENWKYSLASNGVNRFILDLDNSKANTMIVSNYFLGSFNKNNYNKYNQAYIGSKGELLVCYDATTTNDFKSFLRQKFDEGNPVVIYYMLAEEKHIILDNVRISLYKSINHIELMEDIQTETHIRYLKNTAFSEAFYTKSEAQAEFEIVNNSITNKVSEVNTSITNGLLETNERFNDYALTENVTQQINSVENKITSSEQKITIINETLENGISQVRTEKGYTFNDQGLSIDDSNSKAKNLLNEVGMTIIDKSTNSVLLFAGYDEGTQESIVKSKNMTVEKYLVVPNCRFESYQNPNRGKGTGVFDL